MTIGFDKPLYVLPFDHRATFQSKMFGWKGTLTPSQSEEITAAKRVIYDGFKAALAAGVPKALKRLSGYLHGNGRMLCSNS